MHLKHKPGFSNVAACAFTLKAHFTLLYLTTVILLLQWNQDTVSTQTSGKVSRLKWI